MLEVFEVADFVWHFEYRDFYFEVNLEARGLSISRVPLSPESI